MRVLQLCFLQLFLVISVLKGQDSYLTITSPIQNEVVVLNEDFLITWTSINIDSVRIEYSSGDFADWAVISKSTKASQRQFNWEVPSNLSGDIKIRISDVSSLIYDISENIQIGGSNYNKNYLQKVQDVTSESAKLRIMPLGNSITRGILGSANESGYRKFLDVLLTNAKIDFNFVGSQIDGTTSDFDRDHEGHGGWSAALPSNRSKSLVDSVYKFLENNTPNIILLHIGTNDIGRLEDDNDNIFDVVNEVASILDSIDQFEQDYSQEILVFLAKIINTVDDPTTTSVNESDTTSAYNIALQTMANSRISSGDKIILVDQETSLNYPSDLTDGVHPNESGYEKMANTWYNSLMNIIPKIVKQPLAKGGLEGDTIEYSIIVESESSVAYQWQKNGIDIFGENSSEYTLSNISPEDSSSLFSCIVSNEFGDVSSDYAKLYFTMSGKRVKGGEILYYAFEENGGGIVNDVSGSGEPLNLTINTPGSINWLTKGISINSPATITSGSHAQKIYDSCSTTNEISFETWITPHDLEQSGPAVVFTMSSDNIHRNFSLLQDQNEFIFRVRTTSTNENGQPSVSTVYDSLSTSLIHILTTKSASGVSTIYINGEKKASNSIGGDFSNWDASYFIGIGNEFSDSKPWLGRYYSASIYNRALSETEVQNNFSFGLPAISNITAPTNLVSELIDTGEVLISWNDNSNNEIGFLIERSLNDYNFTYLDSVDENIVSFVDTNIIDGTKYLYRVSSFNDVTLSSTSNISSTIIPLFAPSDLSAESDTANHIVLNWNDNSVGENAFYIEGKPDHPDSVYKVIDSVAADITTFIDSSPKNYSPYKYRIYAVSVDTFSNFSNSVSVIVVSVDNNEFDVPDDYFLSQNYPNPFNPSTTVEYMIPDNGKNHVIIRVFNSLGEEVKKLVDEVQNAGKYKIEFDFSYMPSGVYFYQINSKNYSKIRKMVYLK